MVAILLFAFVFMIGLGLLLARYSNNPRLARAELDRGRDRRPRIEAGRLRSLTVDLLEGLGLSVVEEELHGDSRRLIATRVPEAFQGSRYVVFVEPSPAGDAVDQATLMELTEYVKSERAAVGMLVTPYAIESGGLAGFEVPIELIDGPRFRQLVATYLPERLPEIDRYRGFAPAQGVERAPLVTRPA